MKFKKHIEELEFRFYDLVLENADRYDHHDVARTMLDRIKKGTFNYPQNDQEYDCWKEEVSNMLDLLKDHIDEAHPTLINTYKRELRDLKKYIEHGSKHQEMKEGLINEL